LAAATNAASATRNMTTASRLMCFFIFTPFRWVRS
jgi:hypothetical protein